MLSHLRRTSHLDTLRTRAGLVSRSVASVDWTNAKVLVMGLALLAGSTAAYSVATGDTLSGIAERHGISVTALADANGLDNPNLIRIGQVLEIPGGGSTGGGDGAASSAPGGNHTVKAGESLSTIAQQYGISAAALAVVVAGGGLFRN